MNDTWCEIRLIIITGGVQTMVINDSLVYHNIQQSKWEGTYMFELV